MRGDTKIDCFRYDFVSKSNVQVKPVRKMIVHVLPVRMNDMIPWHHVIYAYRPNMHIRVTVRVRVFCT